MDGLIFRPVEARDLDELMMLQNSLFEVVYSKDFYVSLLEPGYFSVVAVDPGNENRIVGVATARDCLDEYDLWTSGWECWQGRKSGYIMTLGVHGGYRRRGIGAELLRKILASLRNHGCTHVQLHCLTTNHGAIGLYETNGFRMVQHLPSHYYFNNAYHDALHWELGFIDRGNRVTGVRWCCAAVGRVLVWLWDVIASKCCCGCCCSRRSGGKYNPVPKDTDKSRV